MTGAVAAFLIITAYLTATLSGIFGMAGGLVLMGALALVLPVAAAFATHGILQFVSNGWRAFLQRDHIRWTIVGWYALASAAAAGVVSLLAINPSKPVLFLLLGLVAMLVWLPKNWAELDAAKPLHALISGFAVTAVNLTAGVAGPLLDIFFVRTKMTRHQIVATKAATQVFSHAAKILVYGGLAWRTADAMPPIWVFALAIPASMAGTATGGLVLDRMSDAGFKRWTAWVVTAIGAIYLIRAGAIW
ncbi:MAG: sulfite exporter TauE/SafE family protein [Sphingomonadales bacterium]|nr:sulfite exporter TauE/SafE family protein [Sphingomonadales bacterium]